MGSTAVVTGRRCTRQAVLGGGVPQQGMPEGTTSCAHMPATLAKAFSTPIFLEEQGTWMATVSLTLRHSSLSCKKVEMNSMGSYRANLYNTASSAPAAPSMQSQALLSSSRKWSRPTRRVTHTAQQAEAGMAAPPMLA